MFGVGSTALFYAMSSLATLQSGTTANEPSVYVQSFEGLGPIVDRFSIGGVFEEGGEHFSLELRSISGAWNIRFQRGPAMAVRARLVGPRYRDISFSGIVVSTRSRSAADPTLLVQIPFGPPQEECFVNGETVFESLSLAIGQRGLEGVSELTFPGCEARSRPLPYRNVDGVTMIGEQ